MAIQNNGITFNMSDNANVTLNQVPERRHYTFGRIQPNSNLDGQDAINAHLAGVNAMLSSIIADPEYEADNHLLQILFGMKINVEIVMDTFREINKPPLAVADPVAV